MVRAAVGDGTFELLVAYLAFIRKSASWNFAAVFYASMLAVRSLCCFVAALLAPVALGSQGPPAANSGAVVASRVIALSRDSVWRRVASVPIGFRTFHPQGMVKIGDTLFVSSVEVRVPTKRLATPEAGQDRDAGEGIGHLFNVDLSGNLITDLRLGEGTVYHPGGLDYDGRDLWVPVAEYRPHSRSIVFASIPRR